MAEKATHPSEEDLERYSLNHMSASECAHVEEHLFICESCQDLLVKVETFIADFKAAAEPVSRKSKSRRSSKILGFPPNTGQVSIAAALSIAALLVVAIPAWQGAPSAPELVEVQLKATRGPEMMSAKAMGHSLRLDADVSDLAGITRAELVGGSGARVWTGNPAVADGHLTITIPSPLATGVYWLRVYDTTNQLAREFGLRIT
jgi:hypothetical protein